MKATSTRGVAATDIAHEINNRLTTIVGTVDLMLSQLDGRSEISLGLQDVLAAALEIQELVSEIPPVQPA